MTPDGFDPGIGWRPARDDEDSQLTQWIDLPNGDKTTRRWVCEEPVPLPTEPYTVIRANLNTGEEADLMLSASGHWGTAYGYTKVWATALEIARVGLITGFEVLAEPRGSTAAAILDEVRPWIWGPNVKNNDYWNTEIDKLGRKYGAYVS